jgi:hypothetical protein
MIPEEHFEREKTEVQHGNESDKKIGGEVHENSFLWLMRLYSTAVLPYNRSMAYTSILVETRGRVGWSR